MHVKKTIWIPPVLGAASGLLAGTASVTGLSFLTSGITENAIGFYVTLFMLAAALGGPLAGVIAPTIFVMMSAWFGPPDMKAVITIPAVFWPNLLALGTTVALVGFAYRLIFERVKMPVRLIAWAGTIIAYYFVNVPASVVPQYILLESPQSEILPAVLYTYETYIPQAIFDILITSLVFVALPARYTRPQWYQSRDAPDRSGDVQDD